MKHVFVIFACLFCLQTVLRAQYVPNIRSGRPGQAIGPFGLGAGVLQLQSGGLYAQLEGRDSSEGDSWSSLHVLRWGITETFEVAAGLNWQSETMRQGDQSSDRTGLQSTSLRVRNFIYQGKKWKPSVGMQVQLNIPLESEAYRTANMQPKLVLMTTQNPVEGLTLFTNSGVQWRNESSKPVGFYIIRLQHWWHSSWSVLVEELATVDDGLRGHRFNMGIAHRLTPNFQLDAFAGMPLDDQQIVRGLVSLGISWRLKYNRKNSQ